jgi:hypothetical protein
MMMKNMVLILSILLATLGSCDKKNDSNSIEIINPISLADDSVLSVFLGQHLPTPSVQKSECFFVENNIDQSIVINSMSEFENSIYCSDIMFPEIDFESYTLIIGQHRMPNSFYRVVEQNIFTADSFLTLNLKVALLEDGGSSWPAFSTLYYWGLYPKIKKKNIHINIVN